LNLPHQPNQSVTHEQHKSVASLSAMDELAASVAVPFEQAHAMPCSVYTSDAFLRTEIDNVFGQDWFCAGRASSISNPGEYLTLELAGQPIMVIREKNGELRAQSNVCLHRMSTLLEGRGKTNSIVCPYHAWTYELDGQLRGAPAMDQNQAFCKNSMRLPEIRCEQWLGWIMVTLNNDAPSVESQLAEVTDMVADYQMTDYHESFFVYGKLPPAGMP